MSKSDGDYSLIHTPDGQNRPDEQTDTKFSFTNFSKEFDDHIDKSIRGYSTLRQDVLSLSRYFVENDTTVLDLGCSQGSLLRKMYENNIHVSNTEYLGVEINGMRRLCPIDLAATVNF